MHGNPPDERNSRCAADIRRGSLRRGEMIGLEWTDVHLAKRQLCVARSDWRGHVSAPKGGRIRYVPLTKRLAAALQAARHLRGPRVLCDNEGKPLTQRMVQVMMRRVARRANVKPGLHILRHTFCSHLAMRGAPARAIQELAGHQDLATTQRAAEWRTPRRGRRERAQRSEPRDRSEPAKRRARARVGEFEGRSPSNNDGGGAGSCTRVRKYIPAGIYDAYPPLKCRTRREETEKPPGASPRKSRRSRPGRPGTASLLK